MSTLSRRVLLRNGSLMLASSLLPLAFTTSANAAGKSAQAVIEEMVKGALQILRDPAYKDKPEERKKKLRALADKAFDWESMARGSLGHYWRKLTDDQKKEFVTVFKDLLANQYMEDIERFQGNEDVKVLGAHPKDNLYFVKTELITASDERVPMDYTLHPVPSGWMIEDLAIEGVSMVGHYRDSFRRFLVNKDFAQLLEVLKRKLGK